ncbi:Alanine--tRNA ligase [Geodia barretti]|uniref:Alanine--tRNA ligase n=1 Tax=Geodia barretti TaxID=519541 RepID=A0AA35QWH8_GEOBA|nr:Alanine--tRNA ligase [Geodia barretti]
MTSPPTGGAELRRAFLDFFAARDHLVVKSSSLVPHDDPTLLFANAGMNQFKDYFLGYATPEKPRAVSVQKCVRAGGKHNDLDNVGFTPRHHTFFEMLGNFSFGDYFKEDAIALAWEFLTRDLGLDPDRLSASVFAGDRTTPPDEEARAIWKSYLPEERISALPAAENFWSMGDTGPCGPCSEIHYDQGPAYPDDDRYLEIWNLVFMQFDRDDAGTLTPLPAPSVDTGMGLERLAAVVQGVRSNYDTDLFAGLVTAVEGRAARDLDPGAVRTAARVIADHARATAFLIADGVLPANEGRGYVLRKILRRALRFGRKAGVPEPFLPEMTDLAISGMADAWPELGLSRDLILRVAAFEEERFSGTLATAMGQLDRVLARGSVQDAAEVPGEDAFRLYDTFGLPLDLVEEVAREHGMSVDHEAFEGKPAAASTAYRDIAEGQPTRFLGYDGTEADGCRVLAALAAEESGSPVPAPALLAGATGELILDRTPFYPEGGGQVGDRGLLRSAGGIAEVVDSQSRDGLVVHTVRMREGAIGAGERVEAFVDRTRRRGAAEHHTMTHLLHAALRDTLGPHVKQAGSLVAPERLRFDFTHYAALTPTEIGTIEGRVNEQIRADREVLASVMPLDMALARGALAFFGDKYGTEVRVIEVPEFSVELCGGTHLGATGQAGVFVIVSEESVSAGVRRVEALTGRPAIEHVIRGRRLLGDIGRAANTRPEEVARKVEKMRSDLRRMEREVERLQDRLALRGSTGPATGPDSLSDTETIAGILVWMPAPLDGVSKNEHRRLMDAFRDRQDGKPWVAVSASVRDGRAAVILGVSEKIAERLPANRLLGEAATLIGGRGGGRADRAEGGGPDPGGLPAFNEHIRQAIRDTFAN